MNSCATPMAVIRRFSHVSLAIAALVLAEPSVTTATADEFVSLGNGVVLAYKTGDINPTTLSGAAEGVRLQENDDTVVTISSLRLETRGAYTDRDFTIAALDARNVRIVEEDVNVEEINAKDVPVGTLRAFAERMERGGEPEQEEVLTFLRSLVLGEVTLRGLKANDGETRLELDRVSLSGVSNGTANLIELKGGLLRDEDEPVTINVRSAEIRNLSIDPRTDLAADISGVSISGDDLDVTLASLKADPQTKTLADGTNYPARSSLSLKDLVIRPGAKPDRSLKFFFANLGEDGLRLQLDALSTAEPNGSNFDIDSSLDVSAQTGDALVLKSQWQLPIVSWQLFNEVLTRDPAGMKPETAMQMLVSIAFENAELTLTSAALGDALFAMAAKEEGLQIGEMREQIADDVTGALAALPDGGAAFRSAVRAFILRSGTLNLAIRPPFPIPLGTLMVADEQAMAIWNKLNIRISHTDP